MDLHTLRFFKCVADEGSFTAASESLHYAQSNLSTQIRSLEEELGTCLFFRSKRGVTLTAKGEQFYAYADRILKLTEESVSAVRDDGRVSGPLHLGSLEATALGVLPELFSEYHRKYPDVLLSLVTEMNDALLEKVLNHRLDGAFVSSPGEHPALNEVFLKKEELILVGGEDAQWENAEAILREAPLITFPPDSIFRNRFELLLSSYGISYGNRMTILNSRAAMILNIISGLGYGYLPRSIVQPYIEKGVMKAYELEDPYAMLDIVFIYRKDHVMNPAIRYFIEMLKPAEIGSERGEYESE